MEQAPKRSRKTPPSIRLDTDTAAMMAMFAALSDPTRLGVIERLSTSDATVTELAQPFPMALGTFSRHLKILEQAGLVIRRPAGRVHLIQLNQAAMARLKRWLDARAGTPVAESRSPIDEEVRRRLFELPLQGDSPTAREKTFDKAEALLQRSAVQLRVVSLAMGLEAPASGDGGFDPEAYAARQLAARARDDLALQADLRQAVHLHAGLRTALAEARSGGGLEPLSAWIYPLSDLLFAWRSHPFLKDAFPRGNHAA